MVEIDPGLRAGEGIGCIRIAGASRRALRALLRAVNLLRVLADWTGCGGWKWCYCVAVGTGWWGSRLVASEKELFGDLPEQRVPEAPGRGMPRLRRPERHQLGWQVATIDDLVARDHPVRVVWAFVQALDLRSLLDAGNRERGCHGSRRRTPR